MVQHTPGQHLGSDFRRGWPHMELVGRTWCCMLHTYPKRWTQNHSIEIETHTARIAWSVFFQFWMAKLLWVGQLGFTVDISIVFHSIPWVYRPTSDWRRSPSWELDWLWWLWLAKNTMHKRRRNGEIREAIHHPTISREPLRYVGPFETKWFRTRCRSPQES